MAQKGKLEYKNIYKGRVGTQEFNEKLNAFLMTILLEEGKILEKSYVKVDIFAKKVKEFLKKDEISQIANEMYDEQKRINYIAEFIYDEYLKDGNMLDTDVKKFSDF